MTPVDAQAALPDRTDNAAADVLYRQIKATVEEGIRQAQMDREMDPERQLGKRLLGQIQRVVPSWELLKDWRAMLRLRKLDLAYLVYLCIFGSCSWLLHHVKHNKCFWPARWVSFSAALLILAPVLPILGTVFFGIGISIIGWWLLYWLRGHVTAARDAACHCFINAAICELPHEKSHYFHGIFTAFDGNASSTILLVYTTTAFSTLDVKAGKAQTVCSVVGQSHSNHIQS